ncbi:ParA family protein [Candidatus Sumerlaeota bacterium]|nr:ParA family protein [Candidatus Sumerlaeota bacterium]
MKAIATVNFKGGVGKTTITWLLAKYAAEKRRRKVLVVDTDAQMSLTLAVHLQETGAMYVQFEDWYERQHKKKNKTIYDALEQYEKQKRGHFDFPIDASFIHQMSPNLHFVPSVVQLYWLELEVFDREKVKYFIRALMGKIEHSRTFQYDYVFFDCPPNFTALSHSVLSCSSLILIPLNPDVFASHGIELMIDGLRYRIEPWPNPKIGVFMNKAKLYRGQLTKETDRYWMDSRNVCDQKRREGVQILEWDSYIPERVDIKRAIPGRYFPSEFEEHFAALWNNIEKTLE